MLYQPVRSARPPLAGSVSCAADRPRSAGHSRLRRADAARRRAAEHQEPGQAEHRAHHRRFDVDAVRLPARLRGYRFLLSQRIGRRQHRLRKHRRNQRFHLCRWRQVFVARIHFFAVRRAVQQLRNRLRRCRPRRRLLRRGSADLFARHRPGPAARRRDLPRGTRGKLAEFAASLSILADVAAGGAQQRAESHVLQPAADLRAAGRCDWQKLRSDGRGAHVDLDAGTGRSMGVARRLRRSDRNRQHRQVVQFRLVDRRGDRSDAVSGQRRRRRRFRDRRGRRRPRLHVPVGAAQFHRQRLGGCDDRVQLRRAKGDAQRLAGRHRDQRQLDSRAAEPEVFLRKRKHTLVRYHQPVVAADRAGPGADLRESPEPGMQRLCPGVYQGAGQL